MRYKVVSFFFVMVFRGALQMVQVVVGYMDDSYSGLLGILLW